MAKITTFESSSAGNLHLIESNDKRILLECGLPFNKIRKYLDSNLDIDACLLSHYHGDHAKSAAEIMKSGIDLYCSRDTAEVLELSGHRLYIDDGAYGQRLKFFKKGEAERGFKIVGFVTDHDTAGALGYLIDIGTSRILFATDTASMRYRFPGMTHIMIECNYSDEDMTDMLPFLVNRIKKTHMSLEDCLTFLADNDLSKVREIHLIHLSKRNSDPKRFKAEVQKATGLPVIIS